jgi:positive regulator of sigma E activity
MSKKITHRGKVVKKIDGNKYVVEVMPMSACSSCSMGGSCHGGETSQKTFTITSDQDIDISSEVLISLSKKSLLFSVLTAYILPIILMLIIAVTVDKIFSKDIVTAIVSLVVLGIYFVILRIYLKSSGQLNITIEKTEKL